MEEQYIISWMDGNHEDHWHYQEGLKEAQKYYDDLLEDESNDVVSLNAVVESNIYSTHKNFK